MRHWSALFSNTDPERSTVTWVDALQMQQRFWAECCKASQLWLSWWVSSLPPMDWSASVPIVAAPGRPARAPMLEASATAAPLRTALVAAPERAAVRKPRATAAVSRHH